MASHSVGTVESLQLAIEATPAGALIVEPSGKIVAVNQELEREFGYPRAELAGQSVHLLVPELLKSCQAIQCEGDTCAPEARRMGTDEDLFGHRKDGTRVPVEIGLNPIQTPTGLLILISVAATVRRQREHVHIVGRSLGGRQVLEQIEQVASTDSTVLILGETGTGKELFATHIHELSPRRNRAMVRMNCGAIPPTLIESELFGRERGAFTGALARQVGRFELADHSTIFLDEIGDLPSEVQVKLLRVLEEHQIERLGSPTPITVNVRVIAATHRNLEQRIAEGSFREDLYYRLNVFPIRVPPLRERTEDIPLLVWKFVHEFSARFGRPIESINKENLAALQRYAWPGNIRELRNVVERAMIGATTPQLTIALPKPPAAPARNGPTLVDVERAHIRGVLENTGWRIRGAGGAAERLGLKPTTLETRMAKLGLRRPRA